MEPIADELNQYKPVSGSWLVELSKQISSNEGVKLYIVSPFKSNKKITKGRITYLTIKSNFVDKFVNPTTPFEKEVTKVINEIMPDIIHIHGTEFAFNKSFLNKDGIPTVISIQGLVSEIIKYNYDRALLNQKPFKKYMKNNFITLNVIEKLKNIRNLSRAKSEIELLKNAKNIIGRTEWDQAHTYFLNPESSYYYLQETIREVFFEKDWNIKNREEYRIFCAGGFSSPLKGLHIILKAVSLLKKEFPEIKVIIVGENLFNISKPKGYKKYILDLIESNEMSHFIEFTGKLNAQEMASQFSVSHLYVMGSSIENSSNTLGEAMCVGVPSIIPYVGGNASIANIENEALYYRFGDIEHLAWNIRRVFLEDRLAVNISNNAKAKGRSQYKNTQIGESLIQIYNDINIK